MQIRSAAVLGAGTMGAQIAAHLANAGVPVLLLDVTRGRGARRARARAHAEARSVLHPSTPVARPHRRLRRGPASDLPASDWIIEAIVERLDVKQALLARVDAAPRRPQRSSARTPPASRSRRSPRADRDEFPPHWLGTHFFNPPRYLRLLELIPTPTRDPAVVETVTEFADHRLGKGVVVAKDTPNFIANRIGLLRRDAGASRAGQSGEFTIEEIDAITGPAIGRPKSATFRTWTSPASTCSRTWRATWPSGSSREEARRCSSCRRSSRRWSRAG